MAADPSGKINRLGEMEVDDDDDHHHHHRGGGGSARGDNCMESVEIEG